MNVHNTAAQWCDYYICKLYVFVVLNQSMHRFIRPLVSWLVCVCVCSPHNTFTHTPHPHTRQLISISNRTYKMNSGCLWHCSIPFQPTKLSLREQVRVASPIRLWIHVLPEMGIDFNELNREFQRKLFQFPLFSLSLASFTLSLEFSQHIKYFKCLSLYIESYSPRTRTVNKKRHSELNNIHSFCDALALFSRIKSFSSENMFASARL